jgi:dipeptidyl aminopeptidase/acylaminoacyl peptidase
MVRSDARTAWWCAVQCAVALALLLVVARPAAAQYFGQNKVQYDTFDFRVLQTPHFDIYYYPSEADAAAIVGRMAERWYARLSTLLTHELRGRQTVVLYGSHPEFEQTNVVEGLIDEATGGVTEGLRRRVVLPLAASLGETDHVLGHELVHAFQYDILGDYAGPAPLWFIEGMAEYLSLGPRYPQTGMWLRDAAIEDRLPDIDDLDNPRYFPYRFGHAFWAYIGGRWGDAMVGTILHRLAIGSAGEGIGATPITVIEAATGEKADALSHEWQQAIRSLYDVGPRGGEAPPPPPGTVVIGERTGGGSLNVGPALSPDGTRIAFLSERNRLAVNLYVADAATGHIIRRLTQSAVDPHFQSLQFLASAGAWSPDGQRLAVATVRSGRPVLAIFNVDSGDITQEIRLDERGEIFQPAWSPDGRHIAFAAQIGGLTDLYMYDLDSGRRQQLTHDPFADLQPAWSPDSRHLAFVTDRFTSHLDTLDFGAFTIAQMDIETGAITRLETGTSGNALDPQWTPDGASLLFLSDATGRPEMYRLDVARGTSERLTNETTGVAGITPLSPAISVAASSGRAALSVFRDSGYEIQFLDAAHAPAIPGRTSIDYAQLPPPRTASTVTAALDAPQTGLPATRTFPTTKPPSRLSLIDVGQDVGLSSSSTFGTYVAGGVSFLFSDELGNHLLSTALDVNGGVKDVAAQAAYVNRKSRWNWGIAGGRVPLLSGFVQAGTRTINGVPFFVEQTELDRQTFTEINGSLAYPFSRASRVEFSAGAQHIGFDSELRTETFDPFSGVLIDRTTTDLNSAPGLRLGQIGAAFVRDTASFGATGPILGNRVRFEVQPTFGDLTMTEVTFDYRRYIMPVTPVTLAARVLHVGRYGRGGEDLRLFPLFLGYPSLVRGYDADSFEASECTPQPDGSCPEFDRLLGSRLLVVNLEARAPVVGLFKGELDYGVIPVDLVGFFDSGVAWTRDHTPSFAGGSRDWVSSAGVGIRVNALGYVIAEFDAAHPIDRRGRGWMFVFNLRPGF